VVFSSWAALSCPAGPVRPWVFSDSDPLGLVVVVRSLRGGPIAAVNTCCQALAQGQRVGCRRLTRRAERVTRAATLITCARMVAVIGPASGSRPYRHGTEWCTLQGRGAHLPFGCAPEM